MCSGVFQSMTREVIIIIMMMMIIIIVVISPYPPTDKAVTENIASV